MATVTITHPTNTDFAGKIIGATFVSGDATIDDATPVGKRQKAYFLRHGYGVGATAAVLPSVADGKPVANWTDAELRAYLSDRMVQFPSGAPREDLLNAVLTAFEIRAEGGAAALPAAGHTQGTFPVEGAPIVPGDDAAKAEKWVTPLTGNRTDDVAPTISAQPANVTKAAGQTATFTVTAAGSPAPSHQWQRQTRGSGSYVDIPGATGASYTTPALVLAENNADRYRVKLSNSDGDVTSAGGQLTVTA